MLGKLSKLGKQAITHVGNAGRSLGIESNIEKATAGFLTGFAFGGVPTGLVTASLTQGGTRKFLGGVTRAAHKMVVRPIGNHPGGSVLGFTAAAAILGTMVGGMTVRPQASPGIHSSGSGYMSWASGRSGGMSPNHLGATGDLTLSMHKTRHRLAPQNRRIV